MTAPRARHPLQKQIADALRLEIAPPGKVSGDGVVWWSIDHASYAGTASRSRKNSSHSTAPNSAKAERPDRWWKGIRVALA
jgi:hypothetical protein